MTDTCPHCDAPMSGNKCGTCGYDHTPTAPKKGKKKKPIKDEKKKSAKRLLLKKKSKKSK